MVLDLGAAPGGWTEYLAPRCRRVVACDLLPLARVPPGASMVLGDVREPAVRARILTEANALNDAETRPFDVVMSDMAPNMSGNARARSGQ